MGKDIKAKGIPRPLVKTNQAVIVISVLLTWLTGQHWILAIPLAAGLSGLLFGYNPVMKAGVNFLKKNALLMCKKIGSSSNSTKT